MGKWILFNTERRWSGPNPKMAASLNHNELLVGSLLRELGFDITLKYDLYFDEEGGRIGLRPSEKGFKCYVSSKNGPRFRITRFCERFNLKGSYQIFDYERDGDMWILPLPEFVVSK